MSWLACCACIAESTACAIREKWNLGFVLMLIVPQLPEDSEYTTGKSMAKRDLQAVLYVRMANVGVIESIYRPKSRLDGIQSGLYQRVHGAAMWN